MGEMNEGMSGFVEFIRERIRELW